MSKLERIIDRRIRFYSEFRQLHRQIGQKYEIKEIKERKEDSNKDE